MLIMPTALATLALFVLAMKATDTVPPRGAAEPDSEPEGPAQGAAR
ncbi:hypothetical protein AB0C93_05775 [Streptomyces sp. NPDC048518]